MESLSSMNMSLTCSGRYPLFHHPEAGAKMNYGCYLSGIALRRYNEHLKKFFVEGI
jgi:hypothetical protein